MCESKPEDPAKSFTEAEGKKQCGLCAHKTQMKAWKCTRSDGEYNCPAKTDCCGFEKKPTVQRKSQPRKKGLEIPPGVKFIYLGRPGDSCIAPLLYPKRVGSRDHQGIVTVAWMLPNPDTLYLGFSFCNPGQKGVPPSGGKRLDPLVYGRKVPQPSAGRPAVPPDSFCKVEGRDIAMKNLYDDPLVYRFLYVHRRAVCDVVKAVLSHDPRLRQFASIPPLLKVPSWTRALVKPIKPLASLDLGPGDIVLPSAVIFLAVGKEKIR